MGRQTQLPVRQDPFATGAPKWPTTMKTWHRDGRMVSIGGGVWLYKKVPLSPVADAKTLQDRLAASDPLLAAYESLAAMTPVRGPQRRTLARHRYRKVHNLMLNVPVWFTPPTDHPQAARLAADFTDAIVEHRVLLLGVQLRDRVLLRRRGLRGAVDSVMETLVSGGAPMADFDDDFERVDAALTRAGLVSVTDADVRLADAWFNHGRAADPVTYADPEHVVVFTKPAAAQHAARHLTGTPVPDWPESDAYHGLSMAAVQHLDLDKTPAISARAAWGSQLIDAGAAVISVRGDLEPAAVTRKEIEAQRGRYQRDVEERHAGGKITKAEQQQMLDELQSLADGYGTGRAPATLVDASVVAGFGGFVDVDEVLPAGSPVELNPMNERQPAALAETFLCSPVRANPHLLDLPVTAFAFAGLVSLSRVGDPPRNGAALVGFTERDRQPAWFDPTAAYRGDRAPLMLVAGDSGSGKSLLMLHLADQLARASGPQLIVDPKFESDFSGALECDAVSLDDLLSADGAFDPLRFGLSPDRAVEEAAAVLQDVNPWGRKADDFEVPINTALNFGVEQGATCIGEALRIAKAARRAPAEMVDRVVELAGSNRHFRALCGMSPQTAPLRIADGITYIRVGGANLSLPDPGTTQPLLNQRIAKNLIRVMVTGSVTALAGRGGVVHLDEAWLFLEDPKALERISRVVRSLQVTVMMYTQRVSDATLTGIDEHIAGGFILPLKHQEAEVACRILQLEPTRERLDRITAGATMGHGNDAEELQPNWSSMRALHAPGTRDVLRGTVALYADIYNRVVPTEIALPPALLAASSTNRDDIAARTTHDPTA